MDDEEPQLRSTHTRLKTLRSSDAERRRSPRLPVALYTDLLDLEGEAVASGTTGDVSVDGLFVRSVFLEPPGTRVRLCLELPGEPVQVSGVVAWVSERPSSPGMGIRLEPGSARWRLGRFLLEQAG